MSMNVIFMKANKTVIKENNAGPNNNLLSIKRIFLKPFLEIRTLKTQYYSKKKKKQHKNQKT